MNRAVVEVALRLRAGGLGKDKKDSIMLNDGGQEKADRERLKIRERERCGRGKG